MATMQRAVLTLIALLVLMTASPAGAQILDVNKAADAELLALPHMSPPIAKGLSERRPFKTIVDLNKFLLEQKLTVEQARDFYRRAFVPINLDSGTREEFMLIPGVGSRM